MRRAMIAVLLVCLLAVCMAGCKKAPADDGEPYAQNVQDKDFSSLRTAGSQEEAYDYRYFFRPEKDGLNQPYVGDVMPYYEDGVYYLYYLKEGGDSYNHSIYLATTTDFLTYKEYDDPVLEASRSGGQDGWTGTGDIVKVGDTYYLFYTGHASSNTYEYMEKVMLAKGTSLTSFEKVEGWEITPPDSLGQKNDFRDPQGIYDPETGTIQMMITASQGNVARILRYTLSADLKEVTYEGILFTDPISQFWNLECSDLFCIDGTYYLTYSGQDDTLWYSTAPSATGPFETAVRVDGKLFYAARHVQGADGDYMAGWVRRSESPSSTQEVSAWGGNMGVQKIVRKDDGTLVLAPVDTVAGAISQRRKLPLKQDSVTVEGGARYTYEEAFTAYECFKLTGTFTYTGTGAFGLALDYNGQAGKYKLIMIDPAEQKLKLSFNEGTTPITETACALEAGKTYSFTYIQEGSVGIFYVDGEASLTVRVYGVSGKSIRLFAGNNKVTFASLREYTR